DEAPLAHHVQELVGARARDAARPGDVGGGERARLSREELEHLEGPLGGWHGAGHVPNLRQASEESRAYPRAGARGKRPRRRLWSPHHGKEVVRLPDISGGGSS